MKLVITLGQTWAVVPEVYAALAPARCRLYDRQPKHLDLPEPDEVWVVTTSGTRDTDLVEGWWRDLGTPVPLRWFRTAASDGNAQTEVELIRELILRTVLAAGSDAVLCLSGGRKTMSADLQRAGMTFGCRAMLHVLPPEGPGCAERLRAHAWTTPLPADLPIQVVLVGQGRRSDLIDIDPALAPAAYPATEGTFTRPERWLWRDLEQREREGSQVLATFHAEVAAQEAHENWRSLYRLPPATIAMLRRTTIGPQHGGWLRRMPKADLHCHLGGVLDLPDQIAVGQAVWDDLGKAQRTQAHADASQWLARTGNAGGDRWPEAWDRHRRSRAAAALLTQWDPDQLAAWLWPGDLHRCGLVRRHPWGFKAYEHPGSLVGSTILQTRIATEVTAQAILDRCHRDGLRYLEIRCSPQKYYPGFLADLHRCLGQGQDADAPIIRVVVIADRRKPETIRETVALALDARIQLHGFVVGVDLAGDEQTGDPADLASHFQDAFAACLPVTIHAGEGQPAANIWKSAYHLHADRIGHGLTLADDPDLARKFRDRRISLELCPTSNREVIGYRDPDHPGASDPYPLRRLLDLGIPLTLCTDNPGISRTTLADEYLAASRMTDGGISCWEALAMIKQGFLHAFIPAHERETLLKSVDTALLPLLSEDLPCPAP